MGSDVEYVLDASAVLALLFDEVGSDTVADRLGHSAMSTFNWGEMLQVCIARGADVEPIENDLKAGLADIYTLELDDVTAAAKMWPETKAYGLSLGDRVCLALAKRLDTKALTCDRAWLELNDQMVEVLR